MCIDFKYTYICEFQKATFYLLIFLLLFTNRTKLLLISHFRPVVNVAFLLSGDSPSPEFYFSDVSEHSFCSTFIGRVNKKNKHSISLHNLLPYDIQFRVQSYSPLGGQLDT
jgi:hypothetical protein